MKEQEYYRLRRLSIALFWGWLLELALLRLRDKFLELFYFQSLMIFHFINKV